MIETGKAIPKTVLNMPLALSGGADAKLADFSGRWLALYFYPKDSTPGCTTSPTTRGQTALKPCSENTF